MASDSEERRFRRISTDIITHFRRTRAEPQQAVVRNISLGGVFIETHSAFAEGDVVEFDMLLAQKNKKEATVRVSVAGEVRWIRNRAPRGIGVEITKIAVEDKNEIRRYIRETAREGEGTEAEQDPGPLLDPTPPPRPKDGYTIDSLDLLR